MAIVRSLQPLVLERDSKHSEVKCTFSVVTDAQGEKHLQIDTYGSSQRQLLDKKSQSIRFTREAIRQLKTILAEHF